MGRRKASPLSARELGRRRQQKHRESGVCSLAVEIPPSLMKELRESHIGGSWKDHIALILRRGLLGESASARIEP